VRQVNEVHEAHRHRQADADQEQQATVGNAIEQYTITFPMMGTSSAGRSVAWICLLPRLSLPMWRITASSALFLRPSAGMPQHSFGVHRQFVDIGTNVICSVSHVAFDAAETGRP
jgi:hypothetical protein